MTNRHQELSSALILQLNTNIVNLSPCCENYLHAPGGNVPDQGEGTHLRVLQVEVLHLQQHLPDDVISAVAVKAQDHKVESKNLK